MVLFSLLVACEGPRMDIDCADTGGWNTGGANAVPNDDVESGYGLITAPR